MPPTNGPIDMRCDDSLENCTYWIARLAKQSSDHQARGDHWESEALRAFELLNELGSLAGDDGLSDVDFRAKARGLLAA